MTQEIIASVLMGKISQEQGSARMSCNLVASRQMICKCNNILDQRTVVCITVRTPQRQVIEGICPACWEGLRGEVIRQACNDTKTPMQIETWDKPVERFNGFTE